MRISARWTVLFMLIVVSLMLIDTAAAEEVVLKNKKSIGELFASTGFVGWLLVGVSIAGVALTIEHFVNLRPVVLAPPDTLEEIETLIEENNCDEAIEVCDASETFIATLVGSALRFRHAGYEHMVGVLEQAAAEESFKLQAKISYLSLLGNVAPLLGLLGTVTGMITSFQKIEQMKAPTPGDLASGVYESLVNTTMGLFVAIVFLTLYFVFKNKVTRMCLSMSLRAVEMIKSFAKAGAH